LGKARRSASSMASLSSHLAALISRVFMVMVTI